MSKIVTAIKDVYEKRRKCGYKKEHGVYAISAESSENGVLSRFTLINPPIPYQVKVHRSPRVVDAHKVLSRQPMNEWWVGGSKETEAKKKGDAWAIDTFGMTLSKRLKIGECAGAQNADEALGILVGKIRLDMTPTRLREYADYIREMTYNKVDELPLATAHFVAFHEAFTLFLNNRSIGNLMDAQAALWRIAYGLPPSKRGAVIPTLQRFLVLMNLRKDAGAMARVFGG